MPRRHLETSQPPSGFPGLAEKRAFGPALERTPSEGWMERSKLTRLTEIPAPLVLFPLAVPARNSPFRWNARKLPNHSLPPFSAIFLS
ncbi:Hypothetical protein NTJ_08891 [Nesidiocoris tenuis]|uniref:Uncharacterized protein n=1 Tax=Nesidiocoris tenuis TaxID=355587 RepID=A0ABN7B025_9HEMI|nr:Hypothetical protein NTJ_08891 [Nesidiocoris tenuis]